jgi:hypothetical protein
MKLLVKLEKKGIFTQFTNFSTRSSLLYILNCIMFTYSPSPSPSSSSAAAAAAAASRQAIMACSDSEF